MVGNRNTSGRQRVFVGSGKQEGVPEITRGKLEHRKYPKEKEQRFKLE